MISSEDSDSPAVYGDLFPSSGVPSGIVLQIDNPLVNSLQLRYHEWLVSLHGCSLISTVRVYINKLHVAGS